MEAEHEQRPLVSQRAAQWATVVGGLLHAFGMAMSTHPIGPEWMPTALALAGTVALYLGGKGLQVPSWAQASKLLPQAGRLAALAGALGPVLLSDVPQEAAAWALPVGGLLAWLGGKVEPPARRGGPT